MFRFCCCLFCISSFLLFWISHPWAFSFIFCGLGPFLSSDSDSSQKMTPDGVLWTSKDLLAVVFHVPMVIVTCNWLWLNISLTCHCVWKPSSAILWLAGRDSLSWKYKSARSKTQKKTAKTKNTKHNTTKTQHTHTKQKHTTNIQQNTKKLRFSWPLPHWLAFPTVRVIPDVSKNWVFTCVRLQVSTAEERSTKSDEYSAAWTAGDLEELPNGARELAGCEVYGMLVVRCVGGRTNVCLTNEIDKEKLKRDVFDGPYHSVFGDRVRELNKPYREIVVYDKDW